MTATLPEVELPDLTGPRFTDADMWIASMAAIRTTAMLDINEDEITETEVNRRLARHARHDISTEDLNQAYEDLKDRLSYLSWLHSDDYDPMQFEPEQRDLEQLAGDAEDDIEHHLRQIVGPHPALKARR